MGYDRREFWTIVNSGISLPAVPLSWDFGCAALLQGKSPTSDVGAGNDTARLEACRREDANQRRSSATSEEAAVPPDPVYCGSISNPWPQAFRY
jgi:hypothetical protein